MRIVRYPYGTDIAYGSHTVQYSNTDDYQDEYDDRYGADIVAPPIPHQGPARAPLLTPAPPPRQRRRGRGRITLTAVLAGRGVRIDPPDDIAALEDEYLLVGIL